MARTGQHATGKDPVRRLQIPAPADRQRAIVAPSGGERWHPARKTRTRQPLPTPSARGAAEFSDAAELESFLSLARDALDLCEYVRRVLDRQKDALAAVIAEATGIPADDESCVTLAHLCIEALAFNHDRPDPQHAINIAFDLIENGWNNIGNVRRIPLRPAPIGPSGR
jgi:hypothetical protein